MQHRRRTSTNAFQLPFGLRLHAILLTFAVLSACERSVVSAVEVSARTVALEVSAGDADGVVREVDIENAGSGTLDRLAVDVSGGDAS